MPRLLEYTDQAVNDLDAIRRWLTQPGAGPIARRKLDAIWTTIERAAENARLHPSGPKPGIRELPLPGGFRALYCLSDAGDVRVLRVFGPGQDRSSVVSSL